jgi:hypothetical protein
VEGHLDAMLSYLNDTPWFWKKRHRLVGFRVRAVANLTTGNQDQTQPGDISFRSSAVCVPLVVSNSVPPPKINHSKSLWAFQLQARHRCGVFGVLSHWVVTGWPVR